MKIGLLGYGVVGKGVDLLLQKNHDIVRRNSGFDIEVGAVLCLEKSDDPRITDDFEDFLKRDMTIVVEAMGGVEPAFTFVKRCLEAGHTVVTSNKALVCDKGPELFGIAKKNGVGFYYEASVGGVIPVIKTLKNNLSQDHVETVMGILNGTTNYIFSVMIPTDGSEPMNLEDAIKRAQELGYAEADPTADVGGHDAARKIAIITSLLTSKNVPLDRVSTEGILSVTDEDLAVCDASGYKIKLIAKADLGDKTGVEVAPMLVAPSNPLYSIDGVTNAVLTRSDMAGDILLTGAGAGRFPTASAVVSDVLYAAEHGYCLTADGEEKKNGHVDYGWTTDEPVYEPDMINRYIAVCASAPENTEILAKYENNVIVLTGPMRASEAEKFRSETDAEYMRRAIV